MTMEENWEMFLASNPDPDLEFTFVDRPEPIAPHGLIEQEYLRDDEYDADLGSDFDAVAHQEWVEGKALDGEWEDYVPEPNWD